MYNILKPKKCGYKNKKKFESLPLDLCCDSVASFAATAIYFKASSFLVLLVLG